MLSEPEAWPSCEEADSAGPASNPVKMIAIPTLITGKRFRMMGFEEWHVE